MWDTKLVYGSKLRTRWVLDASDNLRSADIQLHSYEKPSSQTTC